MEIGKPATVANITVAPAPTATDSKKTSDPTNWSGTRPFPEKVLSSDCARKIEQTEPAKVETVAQISAVR